MKGLFPVTRDAYRTTKIEEVTISHQDAYGSYHGHTKDNAPVTRPQGASTFCTDYPYNAANRLPESTVTD